MNTTPASARVVFYLDMKYKKKKLEYVGFAHAPSLGIQKYADFSILLLSRDIERFKEKTLL